MRVVLDPNVLISGLLSPKGAPARVLRLWFEGAYELVVSPLLLAELERVLASPKLRAHIPEEDAAELLALLRNGADLRHDPPAPPPVRSRDPGDDYLLALAATEHALLVSGDLDLLELASFPVRSPAAFLTLLEEH